MSPGMCAVPDTAECAPFRGAAPALWTRRLAAADAEVSASALDFDEDEITVRRAQTVVHSPAADGVLAVDFVGVEAVQSGRGRNPTPSTWAPGTAQDARRHGERHVCIGISARSRAIWASIKPLTLPLYVNPEGQLRAQGCKILLGR